LQSENQLSIIAFPESYQTITTSFSINNFYFNNNNFITPYINILEESINILPISENMLKTEEYLNLFNNTVNIQSPSLANTNQKNFFYNLFLASPGSLGPELNLKLDILFKNFLILSSLISLIIGSLLGLSQIRIKKLLAFSAISHIGFLLLSLSINTEIAIESFFFYLIQYTITNLNIFVILLILGNLINLPNLNKDLNFISELKGIFNFNPILSLSFMISLFSMAGVPPLIGFFGKQQILYSAISADFIFISIVAISMSVISAYYYLNLIKISIDVLEPTNLVNPQSPLKETELQSYKNKSAPLAPTNFSSLLISFITLILLLFIVNPNLILNSIHFMALSLFDG
jgi:NADH-ubiquinone oxidoreductase chain 2